MKLPIPNLIKVRVIRDHCGQPFLVRLNLLRFFGWELKLHVFLKSDQDRELHDHPWEFWSLVLAGEYQEHVSENGDFILRKRGDLDHRPPNWRHRVIITNPCVTLVLAGRNCREWGFWTKNGWVPWHKFQSKQDC